MFITTLMAIKPVRLNVMSPLLRKGFGPEGVLPLYCGTQFEDMVSGAVKWARRRVVRISAVRYIADVMLMLSSLCVLEGMMNDMDNL
jgi:hypothetical protein